MRTHEVMVMVTVQLDTADAGSAQRMAQNYVQDMLAQVKASRAQRIRQFFAADALARVVRFRVVDTTRRGPA